jgi:hypothetical protein
MKLIVTTFLYLSLKLFATSNYFSLTLTTSRFILKKKKEVKCIFLKKIGGKMDQYLGIDLHSTV